MKPIPFNPQIAEKLVWPPTWHQARLLCQQRNVADEAVANIWQSRTPLSAGEELQQIYALIIERLQN